MEQNGSAIAQKMTEMVSRKVVDVKQKTDERFLNLFEIKFDDGLNWTISSRRKKNDLVAVTGDSKPDVVRMLPYFIRDGKTYIVFIEQFRRPLNKTIYEIPAGLIDGGEKAIEAAGRELGEEIGASVIEMRPISKGLWTSAGMTDECEVIYEVQVALDKQQNLEPTEKIKPVVVELSKVPQFLEEHEFCARSYLTAMQFYNKHKSQERA